MRKALCGGLVVVVALGLSLGLAPGASADPVISAGTPDGLKPDSTSVDLEVSVADTAAAASKDPTSFPITATINKCKSRQAVVANKVTKVSFALDQCPDVLKDAKDRVSVTLSTAGANDVTVSAPFAAASSPLPWSGGLETPLKWGLLAGLVTLIAAFIYALVAYNEATGSLERDPVDGKVRPSPATTATLPLAKWKVKLPWQLPGQSMKDYDWTGGPAAKLVFVGAAITTILGLSDKLDPILDKNGQVVLTTANLVASLIAGAGALAVACLQARYTAVGAVTPPHEKGQALGDTELVASLPGVVIGSALTAAAVATQLAALGWLANLANISSASTLLLSVLGVVVVLYCMSIAGTASTVGAQPPMIDDPAKPPTPAKPLASMTAIEAGQAIVVIAPQPTRARARFQA